MSAYRRVSRPSQEEAGRKPSQSPRHNGRHTPGRRGGEAPGLKKPRKPGQYMADLRNSTSARNATTHGRSKADQAAGRALRQFRRAT